MLKYLIICRALENTNIEMVDVMPQEMASKQDIRPLGFVA